MKTPETLIMKLAQQVNRSPYDNRADWARARDILARSFYRELKEAGLDGGQVIDLSREILDLVSQDFRASTSDS